jgi:pimeloyl-ACP methyl ester carboxylesterase
MIMHRTDQAAAIRALRNAAPYMRLYKGKTFVVKAGGGVFGDADVTRSLIEQIAILHYFGVRVIFVHGGGSSRASYRNRYLAARLRLAGWATLRVDLLGESEREADAQGAMRFDIDRITRRLSRATRWCLDARVAGVGRLVLFGASTGAAAAVGVAVRLRPDVSAVIARAGRIDLADHLLPQVDVPALLVVGEDDTATLQLTRASARRLRGAFTLEVVRGAGHTFEEDGALGSVGEVVTSWLARQRRLATIRRLWTAPSLWPATRRGRIVARSSV